MNTSEQAAVATVIYTVISVVFSALSIVFAWAIFKAPLHEIGVPFLGTVLFLCLAGAAGAAAIHCVKRVS